MATETRNQANRGNNTTWWWWVLGIIVAAVIIYAIFAANNGPNYVAGTAGTVNTPPAAGTTNQY